MKKIMKRLSIALMMLVFVMGFAACSSEEVVEESTVDEMTAMQLEMYNTSVITTLANLTDDQVEAFLDSGDDFTIQATNTWLENEEELGAYVEVVSTSYAFEDDIYTVTSEVEFEERNATITTNYDATFMPTYLTVEAQYSLGESMEQAGLNTVMGIGIVFLMLLFLSGIISLFKFIGKVGDSKKEAPKPAPKPAPVAAAPVVESNLVDDGALVAVIAAAIAASENTSTDSFVVRSIRRKPNNKWSRA